MFYRSKIFKINKFIDSFVFEFSNIWFIIYRVFLFIYLFLVLGVKKKKKFSEFLRKEFDRVSW